MTGLLARPEFLWLLPVLLAAGGLTGLLAGLFGVGGGGITVPVLYQAFRFAGVSDDIAMPLSVGTSLAVIIPTSLSSTRAHWRRDAVDRDVLRRWAMPVALGVLSGAAIARHAPSSLFKIVFIALSLFSAWRFLGGHTHWRLGETMPRGLGGASQGYAIGLLSSLMGVGGAQIVNLFMSLYGAPIIRSVATSAAIGVVVSIPGAIGYALAGEGKTGLPPGSLGFVSLVAFILVAPTAVLMAPIGARLAHSWSRRRLEVAFGIFLVLICLRFGISLVFRV